MRCLILDRFCEGETRMNRCSNRAQRKIEDDFHYTESDCMIFHVAKGILFAGNP